MRINLILVNDLGGSRSGEGKSTSAADVVVKEIKAKGGKAVPDYSMLMKTNIETFLI